MSKGVRIADYKESKGNKILRGDAVLMPVLNCDGQHDDYDETNRLVLI